jgi:hypothetical protein
LLAEWLFANTFYFILQGENCDYYFAGEMLTPIKALSEMQRSMIAGLSKNQMYEQCDALVDQITAILNSQATPDDMQKKCKCIKYDGELNDEYILLVIIVL